MLLWKNRVSCDAGRDHRATSRDWDGAALASPDPVPVNAQLVRERLGVQRVCTLTPSSRAMSGEKGETKTVTRPRMHAGDSPELGAIVFEREIPSDVALVHPLVVRTVEFLHEEGLFVPREESRVALCLAEALVNGVVHGNKKVFAKTVRLKVFVGEREWGFLVADEGDGFDLALVPDPLEQDGIWTESGRGIHLMAHYMDRVDYFCGGSTVVVAKLL